MSILNGTKTPATGVQHDDGAIAGLRTAFEAQRRAFAADRQPSLAERRAGIERIVPMMLGNRERISAALSADYGAHPAPAAHLIEVLAVAGRVQHVLDHIEEWLQPRARDTNPALLGTARAYIQSQAKGVVGNIVPWNFPFDLGVGPVVEMLAAGNRVIIKPSEYTPACAALLAEMVAATFPADLVHVVPGGADLARAFTELPWDHLLYTGSTEVGRLVMAAAAKNLVPVTLELGGKCPAVFVPGGVSAETVKTVIGTKIIKNGQMCVTVDHCFVPRGEVEAFVGHAQAFMAQAAPNYAKSAECTGIVSERHLDRLTGMLHEAQDRQCRVVTLEEDGSVDRATRQMPISLVIDPAPDLRMMREEIFGPIMPVIPYDAVEAAVDRINEGDRPLGVYVLGEDQAAIEYVLGQTVSGGAAVNACAIQAGLPSLAFGGVGASGMGRHHGEEGFREFSNQRGIVVRGEGDHIDAFFSPYAKAAALVASVVGG